MSSPELSQPSQDITASQPAINNVMRRVSEAGSVVMSEEAKAAQVNDILTPEGPYRSPADAERARQLVAREVLLNGPAACRNAQEVNQWMGCFEDKTVHAEARRVRTGELYYSRHNTEKTVRNLLGVIDRTVIGDDARAAEARSLGQRFGAPIELPKDRSDAQPTPLGAKIMARNAANMRENLHETQQPPRRAQEARDPRARGVNFLIELSFQKPADEVKPKTPKEAHELLRTEVLSHALPQNLLSSAAETAKHELKATLEAYKGQLAPIDKVKFIGAAKVMAHNALEWVQQVPAISDSVRSDIGALLADLRNGMRSGPDGQPLFTNESMMRVGEKLRDFTNRLLPEGKQLPVFNSNLSKAALEASQLAIAWAGQQLNALQDKVAGLDATKKAVRITGDLTKMIGENIVGRPFVEEPLPTRTQQQPAPMLAPEKAPTSRTEQIVAERLQEARNVLYAAARSRPGDAPRTATQLIQQAQELQRTGQADAAKVASIAYELLSLSPAQAQELQRAKEAAVKSMSGGTKVVGPLAQLIAENPALAKADVSDRGQRAVLVNDLVVGRPPNQPGRELQPDNPAHQVQSLYNIVHVAARDDPLGDKSKAQRDEIRAARDKLKGNTQNNLQEIQEIAESKRRAQIQIPELKPPSAEAGELARKAQVQAHLQEQKIAKAPPVRTREQVLEQDAPDLGRW